MCTMHPAKRILNNDGFYEVHGPKLINTAEEGKGCGQLFFEKLDEHADKVLQVFVPTGEEETFRSAKQRAIRIALALKARGIKPQDFISICAFNSLQPPIVAIAIQFVGGIMAALDPMQSVRDMVYLLGISKPKILFVGEEAIEKVKQAIKESGLDVELVVFGKKIDDCSTFDEYLNESSEDGVRNFIPHQSNLDDTAIVLFSSGTTGLPKGLSITHRANINSAETYYEMGANPTSLLSFASYYWVTAINFTTLTIMKGGKRILTQKWNVDEIFKMIQDYKVTYCFLPSMLSYKLNENNILPYNVKDLEICAFAGGAIADYQIKKLRSLLPTVSVMSVYGLTEVVGCAATCHPNVNINLLNTKIMSCGYPASGIIIRIVNPETEQVLNPNEKGEIRIKCQSQFKEYLNANTDAAFDTNGFIKTGDIGYFDDDNFLYIIDRIKEMFKYLCWHIVPSSLESILYQHPHINEAVVFGIPHEKDGDYPMAVVTLKNQSNVDPQEIEKFVEERVVDYERLRAGVLIVKNILKTPSGKPARRLMRNMVLRKETW